MIYMIIFIVSQVVCDNLDNMINYYEIKEIKGDILYLSQVLVDQRADCGCLCCDNNGLAWPDHL